MGAVLVDPAASFAVTLAEAKAHCRVDGTDDDTYLDGLIAAANAHVENHTCRSIGEQTWLLSVGGFADEIALPHGPVQSVTTLAYYDEAGGSQTLATGWALDNTVEPARIVKNAGATWPQTQTRFDAVRITYVAGYEEAPAPIKHAMLLLICHWYENREAVGAAMQEVPLAVDALLSPYRRRRV